MKRLNAEVLAALSDGEHAVTLPKYDRTNTQAGILHLGIGAFHRAHQAYYTEAVLNTQGGNWGIIGASLRSAGVKNQLAPQDGLYTLVVKGPEGEQYQMMGVCDSVLVGPEDPAALIALMSQDAIKIVSMTVTEKGYCHDPATGDLNFAHPDIVHDLENLASPRSAIGYLVAALAARRDAGVKSFTALSCDNLPNNGRVLEKVVKQFAARVDEGLADWIGANTTFPCTMIDRIVPATTDADREALESTLGYRDEGMVVAEPFTQWVIEDTFCNDRPDWAAAGATFTNEVEVFEKMKLRLLNGSHSTLAYCGYLAGYETISEVMTDKAFVNMITTFMDREAGETVTTPEGFDIQHYKQELRDRFANPGLKHRTWQIAMDGSQKLPQRLLETLREQLEGPGHIDILCLAVAAWIRYVSGVDESGSAIDVQDPLVARLQEVHSAHEGDVPAIVRGIVGMTEVFGADLVENDPFVEGVTRWLSAFYAEGVKGTLHRQFG